MLLHLGRKINKIIRKINNLNKKKKKKIYNVTVVMTECLKFKQVK